jgi:hypothetical protein
MNATFSFPNSSKIAAPMKKPWQLPLLEVSAEVN